MKVKTAADWKDTNSIALYLLLPVPNMTHYITREAEQSSTITTYCFILVTCTETYPC